MKIRGRKKKNPFSELDVDLMDRIASSSVADINLEIAKAAKAEEENQQFKKEDEQLAGLKEQVSMAIEPYKEKTKFNRQLVRFCMTVLSDRGKE